MPMRGHGSLAALAALLLAAPLPAEGLTRHVSHAASVSASGAGAQLLPRERLLWKRAVKEAGLDPEKISDFGKAAAKFPKSWVDQIGKMNHTKKYRFFFQGMGFTASNRYHRAWLFRFVHKKFKPNMDFIRLTDQRRKGYMSMGKDFDFTNKGTEGGFIPTRAGLNQKAYFDANYYQNMAQSNFTLCPGGQQPWSTRLYEAALAKSIPIIHNEAHDFVLPDHADWLPKIGYTFLKGAEYDQKVVDRNYELFIKYQTFIQGDNEPPSKKSSKQELAGTSEASPADSKSEGSDNSTSSAGAAAHEGGKEDNATNTSEAAANKTEENASAKSDGQVSLRSKDTAAAVDQAFEEAGSGTETEAGSSGAVVDKIQEVEASGAAEGAEGGAKEELQEKAAAEEAEGEAQESKEEAAGKVEGKATESKEEAAGEAEESTEETQEDTQEAAAEEDAQESQEAEEAGGEEQSAEAGEAAAEEEAEGEVVDAADGGEEKEYKEESEDGGDAEEQPRAATKRVSPHAKQTATYLTGAVRVDAGEDADGEDDSDEQGEGDPEVEEVDAAEEHEDADSDEQEASEPPVRARGRKSEAKRTQKFRGVAHKKNHKRK